MSDADTEILLASSFFLKNDAKQMEKMRPYPPLGTLYAASRLREKGYRVALFDAVLAGGVDEFEAALAAHRPRVVALYEDNFNFLTKMCLGHARDAAARMSRLARRAGATVVAGGSDVSDDAAAYFAQGVQYALIGEGDHTLLELIDVLRGRRAGPVESVAGLALPGDGTGGVRHTAVRPAERHPDVFPFPAWDLIDVERYRAAWQEAHGYFSLNMVSTRGCPFHCNWCAKPIWGQRYAMRSPADVAEEMAQLKRTLRPDQVWFADDIFGLQPKWVEAFAAEVEARGAAIPFMIQSRVDLMTDKAVHALRQAGCAEVWLGVESGSQKILDAMDKGTRAERVPGVRRRLGAAGIRACFFLQFGYPGEAWDDVLATVELVRTTLPDDVGISVSYPLPGTRFHDMVLAELGVKDHWDESNDLAMMFEGTFTTPFYRRLHRLLHRDLELRQSWAANGDGSREEREALAAEWRELERLSETSRSAAPTHIDKPYDEPAAPDLSRPWN